MALLNSGNSRIDPSSGAVIFDGTPELKEMIKIRAELKDINLKLDKLLEITGDQHGREMETPRLSSENDAKA